jgi:hypothetical protein
MELRYDQNEANHPEYVALLRDSCQNYITLSYSQTKETFESKFFMKNKKIILRKN